MNNPKKFRVAVVTEKMDFLGDSFDTREEVDLYLLAMMETVKLKKYRIEYEGVIIETEQGVK